jgi:DDE superfamily endonuclease
MENSEDDALDLTKAGHPSAGVQCAEGEPLAEGNLAGPKKKARRHKAWIFFQDESGVSQRPSIRRTWAPRGETPVLVHAFNWKKMSLSAAIGYRWDGTRARLFFQTCPDSYNTERLIRFLEDLRREVRGRKVILVWDGLPAHRSRVMKEYLLEQRKWLTVEALPGYSPKLNPVENLWGNIKGQELANRCSVDLGEAATAVHRGIERVVESGKLLFSFLRHAKLFF